MNTILWRVFTITLLVSLCSLFSSEVSAQSIKETYVDSVLQTIQKTTSSERPSLYQTLGSDILRKNSSEEAIALYKYALQQDTSKLAQLNLYDAYSKVLSRSGQLDEAIQLKLLAIEVAKELESPREEVYFNISLANSYLFKNLPDKALQLLNKVEEAAIQDYSDLTPYLYYNKALVHQALNNIERTEDYYLKLYDVVKDYENNSQKRFAIYTIVDFYSEINKPSQLTFFTELLAELYEDAHPDMPAGHMPIKSIFSKRLHPENIPKLKETIRVSDSLNSMNSFVYTTVALAKTYSNMGQSELAIPYLKRAVQKVNEIEKPSQQIEVYSVLSDLSAESFNYKDAYTYKILQASLQDSVTSERMKKNISELEIKFDTEKKEREIIEKNLVIEQQDRQKKMRLYALIALGILLLLLLIFFRYRLSSQKTIAKQNEEIKNQQITELEQKNKLLAMNSMIEGQEAERLRIAKDLHDSLGGLLSTVKAHFTTIQNEITQLEQLNITEKTNDLIDEACTEVRRISHNMMPHALSISGLEGAIEDLGEHLRAQHYEVTVEVRNIYRDLEKTKEVMIYRLVQEIISNILKHAQAKHILIQLIGHQEELTLIIEDDGRGFDYAQAMAKGGLGLKSIQSRVQYLDGTIDWDTQPGNGTSLTITIPKK